MPTGLCLVLLCTLFLSPKEIQIFFSNHKIQLKQAEKLISTPNKESLKDKLLLSMHSAPLHSRPLRLYALQQEDPERELFLCQQSAARAPSNFLVWYTLADYYERNKMWSQSWEMWNKALQLNLPVGTDPEFFISQALKHQPEAALLTAIPIRPDRIHDALYWLTKNGYGQLALNYAEAFSDLDPQILDDYVRLLVRNGQCQKAWLMRPEIKTCQQARLEAKISTCLNSTSTSVKAYERAIGYCGSRPELERYLMHAELRSGMAVSIPKAHKYLSKTPTIYLRRLLIHALISNKEYDQAREQIELLIEQGAAKNGEIEDLKRIRQGLPPSFYPLQFNDPAN